MGRCYVFTFVSVLYESVIFRYFQPKYCADFNQHTKKIFKNMEIYTKLCFLDTYFDLKDYCQLKLAINLPYMLFTVKPMFTATYFYPYHPNPGRREKINLNFNFHTFLWCLKRFYEGLKGLHKTFWGTTKKCENNLN